MAKPTKDKRLTSESFPRENSVPISENKMNYLLFRECKSQNYKGYKTIMASMGVMLKE